MAHLPRFRPVSVALATPANGARSAARMRTRTHPPLHAPPTSLAPASCRHAWLRPGDLTAAPPSHRRLSGASPLRAEGVRESQGLQLQPQHGLFEVRRLPHRRPFLVAAPTPRANVHWRMWCAGHWRPVMRNELSPAGPRQGNGRPGRGSWPR